MKKLLAFGSLLLASTVAAAPAFAAPVLQYQVLDGTTVIGSGSSTTGVIFVAGADSRFQFSGQAVSAPFMTAPAFSNNVFNIQSAGGNTSGTLTVRISTTGLTGYPGGSVKNSFTLNSLNGGPFTSGTISNYFDNSNTAYGTGTLLASQTYTGLASFNDDISTNVSPSTLFSETSIFSLTYGAGTAASTVSASSQLTAGAVPEPASWAMLILGMGAVGYTLRRRRATVRVAHAA